MFRIFVLLLIIINSHNIDANQDNTTSNDNRVVLNSIVRQLFDMFRNLVRTGHYEKNIPVLDPYKFDYASFNLSSKTVRQLAYYTPRKQREEENVVVTANLTNGIFTGLGGFELDAFTFSKEDLSMVLNLTFPLVSFISEYYDMEGKLFQIFPLSGKGIIQIEILNVFIQGKIYMKQSDDGKSILMSRFKDMEFTIEKIQSNTQFDNNIDGVINAMVSDLLAGYLSRFSKIICATYGDVVVRALNSILNKYENWHIIAVIL